jgi:hypothetical protein
MSRILSIRALELPVRSFIEDGLSRPEAARIGADATAALRRNMLDEERHDIALNHCAKITTNYTTKYEPVVAQILGEWAALPDSPILKALTLENGIFFLILPILRKHGGVAISTTAQDISTDETIHVLSHREVCNRMGHKPSSKMDALRKATVRWILGDYADDALDATRAVKISDDLYYKGVTAGLEWNKAATMHGFFESPNGALPYYV